MMMMRLSIIDLTRAVSVIVFLILKQPTESLTFLRLGCCGNGNARSMVVDVRRQRRSITTTTTTTTTTVRSDKQFLFSSRRNPRMSSTTTFLSYNDNMDRTSSETTTTMTMTTNDEESSSSSSSSSLPSLEIPTEWRRQVLSQLRKVIDPDLNADIVTLGFVQNLKLDMDHQILSFDVELTTPACPVKDEFATSCTNLVKELPWTAQLHDVQVTMTAQETSQETDTVGMKQIGAIIAVSSCKGGVGKSTTAVNLAFALQQSLGARVGIFDADIYGPSLPTMVKPDDDIVRFVGRQIAPLQHNGVRLMSFGYINDGSAVMRGPMVTQLLDQFLSVTHWGSLDYLILDMPPGTGDIQLTLTQRLNITAAVIVTTPQELSFADVVRGVEMFDSVNVPSIAVVENMAYYEIEKQQQQQKQPIMTTTTRLDGNELKVAFANKLKETGVVVAMTHENGNGDNNDDNTTVDDMDKLSEELAQVVLDQLKQKEEEEEEVAAAAANLVNDDDDTTTTTTTTEKIAIFGSGHKHRLSEQYGIEHTFSIPLLDRIATNGDSGYPYVLEYPNSPQTAIYNNLAKAVVTEVAKVKYATTKLSNKPNIIYNKEQHEIIVQGLGQVLLSGGGSSSSSQTKKKEEDEKEDEKDTLFKVPSSTTTATVTRETHSLTPANLRRACRCAMCVEELTGRQILLPSMVSENVTPLRMYPTGNYALSVDWSDGHRSLYPYRQIKSMLSTSTLVHEASKEEEENAEQPKDEVVSV